MRFLDSREVEVFEEVADEASTLHALGVETVAGPPEAEMGSGEWLSGRVAE